MISITFDLIARYNNNKASQFIAHNERPRKKRNKSEMDHNKIYTKTKEDRNRNKMVKKKVKSSIKPGVYIASFSLSPPESAYNKSCRSKRLSSPLIAQLLRTLFPFCGVAIVASLISTRMSYPTKNRDCSLRTCRKISNSLLPNLPATTVLL